MALQFSWTAPRYNPYTDVVTFFAVDGEKMVMCNISRDSLESLENAAPLTDGELVAAFVRHRIRIERIVTERHRRGPRLVYALVKTDFGEQKAAG